MKKGIFYIIALVCFVSCHNKVDSDKEYMGFREVKKVYSFPEIQTLHANDMTSVNTPDYFIEDFVVYDSLLFIDTDQDYGILDVLSIDSMKSLGRFLNKGKSIGEFVQGINLTLHMTFETVNDSILANVYDPILGRVYTVNITQSIADKKVCTKELKFSQAIPHYAFWAKTINDTLIFTREIDKMETHQNRSIITRNGVLSKQTINKLNDFEVPMNENFNIMSTLIAIAPSNDYVVESMIGMNYINIYSLQKDNGYTICVGKKQDKLSDILSTPEPDRMYVFADLRTYNFGFAVLRFNITEGHYLADKPFYPSILLIDWSGNPIGEIKSEIQFNHFDYDEHQKMLYILDSNSKLLKCKIDIN